MAPVPDVRESSASVLPGALGAVVELATDEDWIGIFLHDVLVRPDAFQPTEIRHVRQELAHGWSREAASSLGFDLIHDLPETRTLGPSLERTDDGRCGRLV